MSEYLAILLGIIPEGGRLETQGEIDPKKIQEIIEPHMPEFLDFETFVKCVLRMYFCCKDKQSSISAGDSSVEVPQGQKETLISETQVHEERLSSATQTE
ncbi:unnamed protein product [Trichobilharzia regenti]|nr:unnamed protein product [Trichobilharzia regenti]